MFLVSPTFAFFSGHIFFRVKFLKMSLTSVNRPEFIPSFSVKVEALQEKERIMFIAVRLAFPEEGQVFLYTFIQIADALSQFLIETFGNHFFVMARHLVQHPLVEMDHVVQYKFFVFQVL